MENFNIIKELLSISPILMLTFGAILILIIEAVYKSKEKHISFFISLTVIIFAFAFTYLLVPYSAENTEFFGSSVKITPLSVSFSIIVLLGTFLVVLLSHSYLIKIRSNYGEYYAIILLSVSGILSLCIGNDLFTFFIGFELMSIAVYILAGLNKHSLKSSEAGMKYFILGAFSSAFLLFGISLIYGATGEIIFDKVSDKIMALYSIDTGSIKIQDIRFYLGIIGIGLLLVGLLFKIGIIPFHSWVPDVYEGAPTTVTAFMSTVIKTGAFIFVIKLFYECMSDFTVFIYGLLIGLAILTMIVGNIIALKQSNIKRLLAYSSIAHSGYIISGVIALGVLSGSINQLDSDSLNSIIFYMLAYLLMNVGAFACIIAFSAYEKKELDTLDSIKGMSRRHKLIGLAFTIFFLSLAGVPATAGFIGKFLVFKSVFLAAQSETILTASLYILTVVGILTSIISVFYYIRVVAYSYFKEESEEHSSFSQWNFTATAFIAMILTILFGILPQFGFKILGL